MKGTTTTIVAFAAAIVAGTAWPWFASTHGVDANAQPTAPIHADYRLRDRRIDFFENESRKDPRDQIFVATLAGEYLQRFRETGDLGDVARAQALAERSLHIQRGGNVAALSVLAAADLSFHEFARAQHAEEEAIEAMPSDDNARAQLASILMERGQYARANRILLHSQTATPSITWLAIQARYNELCGNLSGARIELERATERADRMIEISAYSRAWFHMRDGVLAFEAGDSRAAEAHYDEALHIYPYYAQVMLWQARLYRANRDWRHALAAATNSAQLYPLPEALGYQADAQRALGNNGGAAATDALIDAERTLYNAQGVNDRMLALYYARRRVHLDEALRMARSDFAKQGDEVYADDTMAWVLAAAGQWQEARVYSQRAVRLGTQDSLLQYHAGVIAMETGHVIEASARLEGALALNPDFDAFYSDDARRRVTALSER